MRAWIIRRYRHAILLLFVILTVASIFLVSGLKVNANLFSLLPTDNREVRAFFEVIDGLGFQSLLIAVVEPSPGLTRVDVEHFLDSFAADLKKNTLIERVEYKGDYGDLSRMGREILPYLPFLLEPEGIKHLASRLSDEGIRQQVKENKKVLTSPLGIGAEELILADPLSLREVLGVQPPPPGLLKMNPVSGYYGTGDGEAYFLFMKPIQPPQNMNFSRRLMAEVRLIENASLLRFYGLMSKENGGIKVSYTGGYPIAVSDESITKRDIKVSLVTAFLGILLIFGLAFRRLRTMCLVGTTLMVSTLLTLGLARLLFSTVNILTSTFSAVLIGMTVDYAIHFLNSFLSHGGKGMDVHQRIDRAYSKSRAGIIVGALTSAAAFMAIAASEFRGFRELGLMTGSGMLISMAVMLFLLPVLLLISFRKIKSEGAGVTGLGVEKLIEKVQKHPRAFLAVSSVILVALAIAGAGAGFDGNLRNFRPADNNTLALQDMVTEWLGGSTDQVMLVIESEDEEALLEKNASITRALREISEGETLAHVRSISDYLPPPSAQSASWDYIVSHPDQFCRNRIRDTFYQALDENGFERLKVWNDYLESMTAAFDVEKVLLPSNISKISFLGGLARIFYLDDGYRHRMVTYLTPARDLWSSREAARLKNLINKKLKEKGISQAEYNLTGANLLTGELKRLIRGNFRSAMFLAILINLVILSIYYRSLKLLFISTFPLAFAMITLPGLMSLFSIEFNYLNIIVLPMIIGIGIDYGVFMSGTCQGGNLPIGADDISLTGRACLLAALTTVAGFGSITLSHYPGLRSMGYVAIFGVGGCLYASIVILPAVFALFKKPDDVIKETNPKAGLLPSQGRLADSRKQKLSTGNSEK